MNSEKIKRGIGALDILAVVFTLIGGIFAVVAVCIALNPGAIQAHGTGDVSLFPFIFGAVGSPFLVLGIVFAAISLHRRAVAKHVVSEGYYVMAEAADIRPNYNVRVNGQSPYVLECHYQDQATGALHIFRSRNLYFYPAELAGRQIRVYVDRANMNHYYVDVDSALPEIQVH